MSVKTRGGALKAITRAQVAGNKTAAYKTKSKSSRGMWIHNDILFHQYNIGERIEKLHDKFYIQVTDNFGLSREAIVEMIKAIFNHLYEDGCLVCRKVFFSFNKFRGYENHTSPEKLAPVKLFMSFPQYTHPEIHCLAWEMGMQCLMFFCKGILGEEYNAFTPLEHQRIFDAIRAFIPPNNMYEHFKEREISDEERYKGLAIILPRHTYKSTLIAKAYPLWTMLHYHDISILIYRSTEANAKANLYLLRSLINSHSVFRAIYGNYAPSRGSKDSRWSITEGLEIGQRRIKSIDPTFGGAGIDTATTGGHYDIIIMDDIQDETNSGSEIERYRVRTKFKLWMPLSKKNKGRGIMLQTVWHSDDVVSTVKRDPAFRKRVIVIPAAVEENGEMVQSNFPVIYSLQTLKNIKESMRDDYLFNCNYMLRPVNPKKSWAKYLKNWSPKTTKTSITSGKLIIGGKVCRVFASLDPATGMATGRTRDPCAFVRAALDTDWNIYVLQAIRYWEDIYTVINLIKDQCQKKPKPEVLFIEGVAFQRMLARLFETDSSIRENIPTCLVNPPKGASKIERLSLVSHFFTQGKVHIMSSMRELYEEFLEFPSGTHDDLIDALVYILLNASLPLEAFEKDSMPYPTTLPPISEYCGY